MQGARKTHAIIIATLEGRYPNECDDIIYTQGFSFDVLNIAGCNSFLLDELNSFGARGACSFCLLQWVVDQEIMYRKDGPIQFRVTV